MFEKLIPIINGAEKIGIFAHIRPDGDAMGSSYGLKLALESAGKLCRVYFKDSPDEQAYSLVVKGEERDFSVSECDLLIALDCADSKRLGDYEKEFLSHSNSIAIDHHITHVEYAKCGTVFCEISSTCELIYMLLEEMNIPVTKEIANNLYIGLVTDTGNFKYSGISGDTLRIAAALIDTGIDFAELAKVLFDTKPKEYYDLMKIALDKLKLICGGKGAVLYLADEDFEAAHIKESSANGIVNLPNSIAGVEVGVYIRQRSENEYKVSLRSSRYIDVAEIAAGMGGGGHVRASGYSVTGKTVDQIIGDLIKELDGKWQD